MGLESGTYISDLVSSNPAGTDFESQGDDHLRLIKAILQSTFLGASRPFRFSSSKTLQTTTYMADESADMHKLIPFDATSGPLGIGLPNTTIDGWWCVVVKRDSSTNAITIDPPGSIQIHGGLAITLTKQYQSALVWYDGQAGEWSAIIGFPTTPYYSGGQDIPFSDIVPSGNAKRILGAATATDFSEQTIATVLEWIGTCARGDILLRGASAFDRKALGTSGTFLKSDGTDLVYGLPLVPATAFVTYTSNADLAAIPYDDTVPQIGEGTEILSTTITPIKSTSKINVKFSGFGSINAGSELIAALFKDGAAGAVQAVAERPDSSSGNLPCFLGMEYEFSPGSLNTITFAVRAGSSTGATGARMNGSPAGRVFGGAAACTLSVKEIFTA